MERIIELALNSFPTIPNSIREQPSVNVPKSEIQVGLAGLYHHYYLDNYGRTPPDPNPADFEYLRFLSATKDFRLRGTGIGISTLSRRNRSAELGQAFCRWFLHEHLNIIYFAHIENILGGYIHRGFGPLRIQRVSSGDIPDYLCAENVNNVYIAEAKGRYSSISFGTREFNSWRQQFNRVAIVDQSNRYVSIKGFIVGTRFSTEMNRASLRSRINAEDPVTPGNLDFDRRHVDYLGCLVIAQHYGNIALKLNQPILSASLLENFTVPPEINFQAMVWEFQTPTLMGKRFVGGVYPPVNGNISMRKEKDRVFIGLSDPFRLDTGGVTFIGLEESVFRHITKMARAGIELASEIPQFETTEHFYSGISVLRDGSIIAPADFLAAVSFETY